MGTGRLKAISVLQSVAIFQIVLGHSYPRGPMAIPDLYLFFDKVLYSFHMAVFFVLSGFLFFYNGGIKDGYRNFIMRKVNRLLVPYIFFSTIVFLPKALLANYVFRPVDLSAGAFVHSVFFPRDNVMMPLWFLPTLFAIFALGFVFSRLQTASPRWIGLTTALLLLLHFLEPCKDVRIFNIEGVVSYLVYFWLGCLLARYWPIVEKAARSWLLFIILLITLVGVNTFEIRQPALLFAVTLVGIACTVSFCLLYVEKRWSYFAFMEGYSYQIYLLSWFPQQAILILGSKILGLNIYVLSVLMLLAGLVIPVVCAKFIERSAWRFKTVIGLPAQAAASAMNASAPDARL